MISSLYSFGSRSGSFGAALLVAVCPTRELIAFTRCKIIPASDGWKENGLVLQVPTPPPKSLCVCDRNPA